MKIFRVFRNLTREHAQVALFLLNGIRNLWTNWVRCQQVVQFQRIGETGPPTHKSPKILADPPRCSHRYNQTGLAFFRSKSRERHSADYAGSDIRLKCNPMLPCLLIAGAPKPSGSRECNGHPKNPLWCCYVCKAASR